MADLKVKLGKLDERWEAIVNVNLDALANAKVILNKPEFSTAKKILTLTAVTSAAMATTLLSVDVAANIAMLVDASDHISNNSVPMLLQDLTKSGALRESGFTSLGMSVSAVAMTNIRNLVNAVDKYVTKHSPQIESARVEALASAYGEIYDLIIDEKSKSNLHPIDKTYNEIRPMAEALGIVSQRQKDSVVYSWLSKTFNEEMSVDNPDLPSLIDQPKKF